MGRRKKYDDPKWITRLSLPGRGGWKGNHRPLQFLKVGNSRTASYLWIGSGDDDEEYLLALSGAEARRLGAWLADEFGSTGPRDV